MKTDMNTNSELGLKPRVHPLADITDCSLGMYTEVLEDCLMLESSLGDYSYLSPGCDVAHADIGKFVSVASRVRIGPTNHPMWRATQHHFTYRSSRYGFGADDEWIFDWRRKQRVVIGNDVWLGHGAIVLPGVTVGDGAVGRGRGRSQQGCFSLHHCGRGSGQIHQGAVPAGRSGTVEPSLLVGLVPRPPRPGSLRFPPIVC